MATARDNLARKQIYIPATQPEEEIVLRVAAYCRVSTDSDDQLNSFAAQNAHYNNLIKSHDRWELVDIYADEGITGTSAKKRGDFQRMLEDCLAALEEADGATIATPSRDTVKLADEEGYAEATTDRSRTWLIQTPQAFYREELLAMHRALGDGPERGQITDDCMLLERAGRRVKLVPGCCRNLKTTATPSCSPPASRSTPPKARA